MLSQRLETRCKEFMRGCDPEEAQKKREESHVELRKSKRSDRFMQKRGRRAPDPPSSLYDSAFDELIKQATSDSPELPITSDMTSRQRMECLFSTFRDTQKAEVEEALLTRVHVVLSSNEHFPLIDAGNSGILPKLVRLTAAADSDMASKAAWVVANIASATDDRITSQLIECEAVPRLIANLTSSREDVVDNCIWALSNIAGERDYKICMRNYVLDAGVLDAVVALTDGLRTRSTSLIQNLCWMLRNITIGSEILSVAYAEKVCWVLMKCLQVEDVTALTDCFLAVYELTKIESELLQVVLSSGLVPALFPFLQHSALSLRLEALKPIANVVAYVPSSVPALIELGLLDRLYALLSSGNSALHKESLWLLSSIFACGQERVEATIAHPLFPRVIHFLIDRVLEIREEAIICLYNATCNRGLPTVSAVMELGGVELLCENLSIQDSKILQLVLDTIHNMLEGVKRDPRLSAQAAMRLESAGAQNKLDRLSAHRNVKIQNRVKSIYNILDFHEPLAVEETKVPGEFVFS